MILKETEKEEIEKKIGSNDYEQTGRLETWVGNDATGFRQNSIFSVRPQVLLLRSQFETHPHYEVNFLYLKSIDGTCSSHPQDTFRATSRLVFKLITEYYS